MSERYLAYQAHMTRKYGPGPWPPWVLQPQDRWLVWSGQQPLRRESTRPVWRFVCVGEVS